MGTTHTHTHNFYILDRQNVQTDSLFPYGLIPFKSFFPHQYWQVKTGFYNFYINESEWSHWQHYYPDYFLWQLISSQASWSSPRCFHTLTGGYLWWVQLIGHTLVCIRSHSWQSTSEQRPGHEVEGAACGAQTQLTAWNRDWIPRIKSGGNQASLFIRPVPLWHAVTSAALWCGGVFFFPAAGTERRDQVEGKQI